MTDQYAVFGNPINHSKSPMIHALFAEQTRQNLEYTKQLVAENDFANAAKKFFDEGGKGLNITVPFKLDAFAFAEKNGSVSERARLAGAVNTLKKNDDGKIFGDNTDGVGLVRDITQNLGWEIKDKRILILGAGGAVRGVLGSLLEQQPTNISITNRTLSKAEELKSLFQKYRNISVWDMSILTNKFPEFDLIIHGTSAGLQGWTPQDLVRRLPPWPVGNNACAYDITYGVPDQSYTTTPFLSWAEASRILNKADGLGMLVEQAAESFRIWRKRRGNPINLDTKSVIAKVRSEL